MHTLSLMVNEPDRPLVSVIVPVRNGAEDDRALLACLERPTLPRREFEIVIGDDGSSDGGTDGIETPDGHVTVVRGDAVNAYRARNRAVAAAHGQILAFTDADCRPVERWLEAGLEALGSADLVAGRIRFQIPPGAGVWSLLDAETTKDHKRLVKLGVAETANLFVKRKLFDRVGTFDEAQPGYGDYEFVERCVQQGAVLAFSASAIVTHPVRVGARSFLRNVWNMNSSYGAFESRASRVPEGLWLRSLVPVVQVVRSRRRSERSLTLDARWLAENGVRPTALTRLKALPVTYLLLPYVGSAAQLAGWWKGRRSRSTRAPAAPGQNP